MTRPIEQPSFARPRAPSQRRRAAAGSSLAQLMPWVWKVPVVSEHVAAQLFVTPFGALRDEERELPATPGEAHTVCGQRRVRVTVYGSGRPVYLVHGWGGRGLQMSGFVDAIVARGHQAITIDLPAHGESEGTQTNVLEASDALLAVQRRFGEPFGVIAHSFGAAATVLAQQRGLRTGALVFIAPLPSLEVGIKQFAVRARLPLPVLDRASRLVEKSLNVRRRAICLHDVGPELRTPLLLVHDHDDGVVDIGHSRDVTVHWPGSRLLETEGLGHRRVLRDRHVIDHAAAFLEQGTDERQSDLTELIDQC